MGIWGSSPIDGRLGKFGKGYELVCSLGIRHVICKPRDKPDQQYIKRPLMQMWVCATYGEQFLCRLHEWKNPHNILSKLFCYVVEDEHSISQYTRSDIIRFLALKLEQRQLLIFETDELSLTSSVTSYTGETQQIDAASKSTLVLSVSDHESSDKKENSSSPISYKTIKSSNSDKAVNQSKLVVTPSYKTSIDTVYHVTTNKDAAQGVLGGIDPKYLNPNSRFGVAFYVAEKPGTTLAELAHHGITPSHGIRYEFDSNNARILDFTDQNVANAWSYIGGPISSVTQQIGVEARQQGFNVIRFYSERSSGGINNAILDDFNELLTPQFISPT